jgi:HEAT repeat-containing protein 5
MLTASLRPVHTSFIESHYSLIILHLVEVILNPITGNSCYDMLLVRSLVGMLLRDLIRFHMLSELAIQKLANTYLKQWPAMMPGQVAPSTSVLVFTLREVAGLLQQLRNALPVQVYFIASLPCTVANFHLP